MIKYQNNNVENIFDKIELTSMFNGRYHHSTCLMDSKYLVVTGGCKAGRLAEVYNILNNSWRKLPNLNLYRANHASCSIKSNIYLFGFGNSNKSSKTIESLSINDHSARWQLIQVNETIDLSKKCFAYPMSDNRVLLLSPSWPKTQWIFGKGNTF